MKELRRLPVGPVPASFDGTGRASTYAEIWLAMAGAEAASGGPAIRLWDFQVGMEGSGADACAVAGPAAAIGHADGPGVPLPADMPEKWCGLVGAILALAEAWRGTGGGAPEYDASAADIMRSFALQNSGTPEERRRLWKRNGRICVEHGLIFPMGFFACRDGHIALLGRSRRDWQRIAAALGDPEWTHRPGFDNPFALARDSAEADALLEETLADKERDGLLARGLEEGAVIAPVYSYGEALERGVFRPGFEEPAMPFLAETADDGTTAGKRKWSGAAGPLEGLTCIELCWIWSGPMVGQLLADLGAEVIKIESPDRFDLYRTRGLEHRRGEMDEHVRLESSLYFHSLNRNKSGLSLNLKSEEGRAGLLDLVARADLLIENFTVGTMDRMGLGREVLARANPGLVSLSMSGPGKGSSVERLRSYGLVLSALAGAEILIRDNAGAFVGSPTFSISDPNAACFGALAALAALVARARDGRGRALDLSQIEAAATLAATPTLGPPRPMTVPVVELDESDASPVFADCSGWIEARHPVTGTECLVAAPWRVDGRRPPFRKPAPMLERGAER